MATFEELKPGNYAVVAFHDKNKNGKLDKNIVTKPTEPYGFSNNARGVFGPPNFEAAVFELPEAGRTITFELK